ncbi:MAG TPA: NAD+ synthase [Tepidisphaeraceae bacterium]|nr:NAD+ synthase [Tepidisphaeraceae bacterium]
MRIALAQINPTVGDLAGNVRKHLDFIARAKADGAQLVVFPEMSVPGYPAKDLLLKPGFIEDNLRAVRMIASRVNGIEAVVGYAERNPEPIGRPLHNAVAVLRDGAVASRHFKTLLPTYDVFDESRYFEPGPAGERNQLVRIGDVRAGLSICEDLWNDEKFVTRRLYHQNPLADLHTAGARVMINASASPFVVGKHDFRLKLFGGQAKQFGRPLVVVNQVGGNDELIFDGNSVAFDADGSLVAQAKDFEEDLVIVELGDSSANDRGSNGSGSNGSGLDDRGLGVPPERSPRSGPPPQALGQDAQARRISASGIESMYKALVLGLRDYVRKCGFSSVVLGLSGGIDSALTAALAVDALGPDKVVGVAMPSRYSSGHSVEDARQLALNLGIAFHIVPIKSPHDAYEATLGPLFSQDSRDAQSPLGDDLTEQNIQARIRGATLMAFSNRYNHLLLTTGNKSEMSVGYATLYGDMCGGLAVISDVPKTTVWELSKWINAHAGRELIPTSSITKVPSAELRPNQTDQDSLPPYPVLDAILYRYVEEEKGAAEIIGDGFDPATVMKVIKLTDRSEYKRRQAPPGLKVTGRAFGSGRRMPIAQRYEQQLPKHGEPGPAGEAEQREV